MSPTHPDYMSQYCNQLLYILHAVMRYTLHESHKGALFPPDCVYKNVQSHQDNVNMNLNS